MKLKLESLLTDRSRLAAMKSAAQKLAKPQAAFDVARLALGYAE
jgi:UDP-N-acetylglucosamine:LPS N-acetylglucosamine transferase